jgi:SAM-dependent methyltransferase
MADLHFEVRRLAEIYDVVESDRTDLDPYLALAAELGARAVVDVGCGTGTFACLLAARGFEVTGIDPAAASLDVARTKRGAEQVRWLLGDSTSVPPLEVDLLTMTGNVAQVFLTEEQWDATLRSAYAALRPGGRLVFETRDPARKAWLEWTPARSRARTDIPGRGFVETWGDVTDVSGQLVTFRSMFCLEADGVTLTSTSTLIFRDREQVSGSLASVGFALDDIRAAPDRPGCELVFIASRPRDQAVGQPEWSAGAATSRLC